MTTGQAQRTVLIGLLVALVVGLVRDVRSGKAITTDVAARRIFGTFVGMFLLVLLARAAPRGAWGITWLVVLTQLLGGIPDIFPAKPESTFTPIPGFGPGTPVPDIDTPTTEDFRIKEAVNA